MQGNEQVSIYQRPRSRDIALQNRIENIGQLTPLHMTYPVVLCEIPVVRVTPLGDKERRSSKRRHDRIIAFAAFHSLESPAGSQYAR